MVTMAKMTMHCNDDADDVKDADDDDDHEQQCPLQKAVCPCPAQLSSSSAQNWQKIAPETPSFQSTPETPSF